MRGQTVKAPAERSAESARSSDGELGPPAGVDRCKAYPPASPDLPRGESAAAAGSPFPVLRPAGPPDVPRETPYPDPTRYRPIRRAAAENGSANSISATLVARPTWGGIGSRGPARQRMVPPGLT